MKSWPIFFITIRAPTSRSRTSRVDFLDVLGSPYSVKTSTLDDCETKFQSRLSGLAYVNRGVETIDPAALAACIAGYKETATTCAFIPLETACKGVFVGTKAEGAACGVGLGPD